MLLWLDMKLVKKNGRWMFAEARASTYYKQSIRLIAQRLN